MTALTSAAIPDADTHVLHAALVSAVAYWQLVQETRKKVQLPLIRLAKAGIEVPPHLVIVLSDLEIAEKEADRVVLREWRQHPLREWGLSVHGLGEHSLAVLIGLLGGDVLIAQPRARVAGEWVDLEPYERTLSQLRSYCGVGEQRRRVKGMSQEETLALGKPLLKSRLRLIAESFLKAGNRAVYDEGRERYKDRVHEAPCRGRGRCGLDAGTPWRAGHQQAAAFRLVAKTFLSDLYEAARSIEGATDHDRHVRAVVKAGA